MHKSFCIIGKFIVDNLEKRASTSFLAIEKTTWVFGIKKKRNGKNSIERSCVKSHLGIEYHISTFMLFIMIEALFSHHYNNNLTCLTQSYWDKFHTL
jgi:hypothetical protein